MFASLCCPPFVRSDECFCSGVKAFLYRLTDGTQLCVWALQPMLEVLTKGEHTRSGATLACTVWKHYSVTLRDTSVYTCPWVRGYARVNAHSDIFPA